MQVLYLGRALRIKETLPDFLKWRRVTRHPLAFRGLTSSQRTPGFGASHYLLEIFFVNASRNSHKVIFAHTISLGVHRHPEHDRIQTV